MKKYPQLLLFSFLAVFYPKVSLSQPFEGTIEFIKISPIDTIHFIYYIKNNKVRIDEIGYNKKIEKIILVDLKELTTKSLSPERKLFMDLERSNKESVKMEGVSVSKGKKNRNIAGYQCEEWVITKKNQNLQITYFIAHDNFSFFKEMLTSLNNKDKLSTFYQHLPDTKNAFPFYAIEADLQGKAKNTLEVKSINKISLDHALFNVPQDYKKLEK